MVKNKGIFIATIIFIVMALLDVISTWSVGPELIKYLETNPLFNLVGFSGLIVLNMGVAGAFYFGYDYAKRYNTRYALLLTLILISFLRLFIVYNNFSVAQNPPTIEQAQSITTEFKRTYYFYKVVLPVLMSYIPAMISFNLFLKDNKVKEVTK